MHKYSFATVWPNPPAEVRQQAVDFWLRESALSEGNAVERAAQLLVICRRADGEIAAVSTAVPCMADSLGLRCYYFRAFVGQSHRARGLLSSKLIHRLLRESYLFLNDRFQEGIESDVVGLYLEIQNPSILRHRDELVWSDDGANIVLVGMLPDGRQARVWYFENAKVPRDL